MQAEGPGLARPHPCRAWWSEGGQTSHEGLLSVGRWVTILILGFCSRSRAAWSSGAREEIPGCHPAASTLPSPLWTGHRGLWSDGSVCGFLRISLQRPLFSASPRIPGESGTGAARATNNPQPRSAPPAGSDPVEDSSSSPETPTQS